MLSRTVRSRTMRQFLERRLDAVAHARRVGVSSYRSCTEHVGKLPESWAGSGPLSSFTSVDLPAPFSPNSACVCTVAGFTARNVVHRDRRSEHLADVRGDGGVPRYGLGSASMGGRVRTPFSRVNGEGGPTSVGSDVRGVSTPSLPLIRPAVSLRGQAGGQSRPPLTREKDIILQFSGWPTSAAFWKADFGRVGRVDRGEPARVRHERGLEGVAARLASRPRCQSWHSLIVSFVTSGSGRVVCFGMSLPSSFATASFNASAPGVGRLRRSRDARRAHRHVGAVGAFDLRCLRRQHLDAAAIRAFARAGLQLVVARWPASLCIVFAV